MCKSNNTTSSNVRHNRARIGRISATIGLGALIFCNGAVTVLAECIGEKDLGAFTPIPTYVTITPVNSGSIASGRIDTDRDVNYFSIDVPAGQVLRAYSTDSDASLDLIGKILNASGRQFAYNVNVSPDNDNFDVVYFVTTTDTYYIEVKSVAAEKIIGNYTLMVSVTPFPADKHGDTLATATAVTSGIPASGTINGLGDADYFSIDVPAGKTLRAYTESVLNITNDIYDKSGTLLKTENNNDFSALEFDVSYTATIADTYYVKVYVFSSYLGNYTLMVTVQ